jgi:hypothetical protein
MLEAAMLILAFIGGIIATIGVIVLVYNLAEASSGSGASTPSYYSRNQSVRLGPASYRNENAPLNLQTQLDVVTPWGRATYKSSGPPDAVLHGNQIVATALSRGWENQSVADAPALYGRYGTPRALPQANRSQSAWSDQPEYFPPSFR